jgi:biotin carboxyl carrier protein
MTYEVMVDGKPHKVEITRGDGRLDCKLDGKPVDIDAQMTARDVLSLLIDGRSYEIKRAIGPSDTHMVVGLARYETEVRDPRSFRARKAAASDASGPRKLVSPMPGKVVRVLVQEGEEVEAGQGVVVVEAMKMQNEIKSPKKGVVQQILAADGAAVNAGEALVIVE